MIRNDATKKMIKALTVLELSNLIWTKKNNTYFWGTEDGKPTDVFIKTIKALENKGYVGIVHQMDMVSVNITKSGRKFLSECRMEENKEGYLKKIEEQKLEVKEEEMSESAVEKDIKSPEAVSKEKVLEPSAEENAEIQKPFEEDEISPRQILSDTETPDMGEDEGNEFLIKQTVFLIDSENVGNTWLGLISRLQEDDELHVFYTDKSPTLTYETVVGLLKHDYIGMVNWIKCYTGENALDFQLVTELGSMIAEKEITGVFDPYFVILSRDRGYDPVVSYWTKKGIMIKRYSAYTDIRDDLNRNNGSLADGFQIDRVEKEDMVEQMSQDKEEVLYSGKGETFHSSPATSYMSNRTKHPLQGKRAIVAIDGLLKEKTWKEKLEDFFSEKVNLSDPKAAAEYLIEMSRLISMNNEEKYLHAVSTQFGVEKGEIIMAEIRNNKFLQINLSNGPVKNLKTRRKDYIMLFLKNNKFLEPDIRSIAPLLQKPSRVQIENVKQLLLRYHNATETQELIKLIQKHMKVVKEIV